MRVATAALFLFSCGAGAIPGSDGVAAASPEIAHFYGLATNGVGHPTDKVTDHRYELMYGIFLAPMRHLGRPVKMLEIGLGCKKGSLHAGIGPSVALWQKLLPGVELWEAEYDKHCLQAARKHGLLDSIHPVQGSQGNRTTLRDWVKQSGGNFDAIIDDGSHRQAHIMVSFEELWPSLRPGGVYFVEDLHVARAQPQFDDTNGRGVAVDVFQAWQEQLVVHPQFWNQGAPKRSVCAHPAPKDLAFIFCQAEACVLGKSAWRRPAGRAGASAAPDPPRPTCRAGDDPAQWGFSQQLTQAAEGGMSADKLAREGHG